MAERRAWWSVHRPRPNLIAREALGAWAGFAVVARWGAGGQQLIAALAPAGSVPLSGLNAMAAAGNGADVGYLVGLFNSAVVQDLADTLPPGELRQRDFMSLGLPYIPEAATEISSSALEAADAVADLIHSHGKLWPLLGEALRQDADLGSLPLEAWRPEPGPARRWGPLAKLKWIGDVEHRGGQSQRLVAVDEALSLFGPQLTLIGKGGASTTISVAEDDPTVLATLRALLGGSVSAGGSLTEALNTWAPIEAMELVKHRTSSITALEAVADRYRAARASIEGVVGSLL